MASLRDPQRGDTRENTEARRGTAHGRPLAVWHGVGAAPAQAAGHRLPPVRGLHAARRRHHGGLEAREKTVREG